MTTKRLTTFALLLASVALGAGARAQNIDKAIDAYKGGSYDEAAVRFFEVMRFDTVEANIIEAEYGMAQSLLRLKLALPAIRYYENIIGAGATHPYYLKSFEGLLEAAEMLQDDLIVPAILDKKYSGDLGKLQPEVLQRIHYYLGERLYRMSKRGEALDFLRTVKKENKAYAKAQYLIGMTFLGRSAGARADYDQALESFENVRKNIAEGSADEGRRRLRELSTLALARTYYEMGAQMLAEDEKDETKPNLEKQALLRKSIDFYQAIPRFSTNWGDALYERAWAHILIPVQGKNAKGEPIVTQEYGKALGALHSIHAPYFDKQYWPESHILKGIVYYYNCHFDRVYDTLKVLNERYEPINSVLARILKQPNVPDAAYYDLMVDSLKADKPVEALIDVETDALLLPGRAAGFLARDPQWGKLTVFIDALKQQAKIVENNRTLAGGEIGNEILMVLDKNLQQFKAVAGRWVRRQLTDTQNYLQSYVNRSIIVKLETESAEKDWLEMGRSIDKGPRPRLPRPYVPSDKFQYFNFNSEYWADEIGYYEYSIRTECYE